MINQVLRPAARLGWWFRGPVRAGMRLGIRLGLPLLSTASACSAPLAGEFQLGAHHYPARPTTQFKLPKALREVSGLALDLSDRLFAHDDERGIIYQVDYKKGLIKSRFALTGGIRADFEGIAASAEHLYLMESNGSILELMPGNPEQQVSFEHYAAKLDCEAEGLAYQATEHALLVACKNLADLHNKTGILIYRWRIDTKRYDRAAAVAVSATELQQFLESRGFKNRKLQPSGLTIAANGNLVLVAGRQHLLLELSPSGELLGLAEIDKSRHRQTEGIAITGNGVLLLADEGDSKGSKSKGRLSIYEPVR